MQRPPNPAGRADRNTSVAALPTVFRRLTRKTFGRRRREVNVPEVRYRAKLDEGGLLVVMSVLLFVLVTVLLFFSIEIEGVEREQDPPLTYPFAFFFAQAALTVYLVWLGLGIPVAIRWPDGGHLHFEARRHLAPVEPKAVRAVSPSLGGRIVLSHEGGKVWLSRRYEGQQELKARLAEANPYADLRNW